jgi:predicted transposase/invertase (TIGR01784 family)
LEKDTFINEQLHDKYSDIIYSCSYAGVKAKLVLLFDHKSFVPAFPHIQLLSYITGIWNRQMKQSIRPQLIIPIMLYHGSRKWEKRPIESYLGLHKGEGRPYVPEFEYILIDLSDFTNEEIKKGIFSRAAVKIWLLVQKNINNPEELRRNLQDFIKIGILYYNEEEGLRFFESVFRYILSATNIEAEAVADAVKTVSEEMEDSLMTTLEKMEKEIKQRFMMTTAKKMENEIEERVVTATEQKVKTETARKLRNRNMAAGEIAEITGLSIEEIEKIP